MSELFTNDTLDFLAELGLNNNKTWFTDHKHLFEKDVTEPFRQLAVRLTPLMISMDPELETAPFTGKTISRIYRDTRFSKDKAPYRNNMWITFKRRRPDWQDAPAWFFELTPESYRYGMGFYQASPATMNLFRNAVAGDPSGFDKIIRGSKPPVVLEGEEYKKEKPGCPGERFRVWFRKKSFYAVVNREPDRLLFSEDLAAEIGIVFKALKPLYDFLWKIKG